MQSIMHAIHRSKSTIAYLLLDIPASQFGINRIIHGLETSGQAIIKKVGAVSPLPNNKETVAHIIGIERWGQHRLHVALGQPLLLEEYDSYRPDESDWASMREIFRAVRQETISLSKSIRMAGVDPTMRILHNQFGEVSLIGWLFYLYLHANIESMKIH